MRATIIALIFLVGGLSNSFSKEKTFTRTYTYAASEADSKLSARSIAMGQVKQLLLEEIGSYVHSEFIVSTSEWGDSIQQLSSSQVKSVTASISKTKIIEEKWDGSSYFLKARIKIDLDFLKNQLEKIASDQDQLVRLEQLQRQTDSAFAEIERLKLRLANAQNQTEKDEIKDEYSKLARQINSVSNDQPKMEVVFVLDATGSMGNMIANAKDKIWAIATTMAQSEPAPELSIGLIAYRDRTDQYVTKQLPLTNSIDELYSQLLEIGAAGGGDQPENVNQALAEAVFDYQWDENPSTLRQIYLVGDAPPHMDYPNVVSYHESCKEAIKKDIIINTIQCGMLPSTKTVWQEIAQYANGEYLSLNQSGNSFAVKTPFDDKLAKKAKELDKTRMYYGSKAKQLKSTQEELSEEIYSKGRTEEAARRAIYNTTTASGKKSFLGENELLDDYEKGQVDVSSLEDQELPEELQQMDESDREQYLTERVKERKKIEQEIAKLNEERDAYIKKQIKERSSEARSSFNNQMHKVFKEQAADKMFVAPTNAKF